MDVPSDPCVGMTFPSEEDATQFYYAYALRRGFSVRKDAVCRNPRTNVITKRDLVCHKEGSTPVKKRSNPQAIGRERGSSRSGCTAMLRISKPLKAAHWSIIAFRDDHNHELLTPDETRLLPANRLLSKSTASRNDLSRVGTPDFMRALDTEHVGVEYHPVMSTSVDSHLGKRKRANFGRDTADLLAYLREQKEKESDFYFKVIFDDDGRMENGFWIDRESREAYKNFGDVVVFDTAYLFNRYSTLFAPFIGVNNHGQATLLGCALLRNENYETLLWLFKEWVAAVGKIPMTILTNQDQEMARAIGEVMPGTKHAIGTWHIARRLSTKFAATLGSTYKEFLRSFHAALDKESPVEFTTAWTELLEKHNLTNDPFFASLYTILEQWVPSYLRDFFFGGITSTQLSEIINYMISDIFNASDSLKEFVDRFDKATIARMTKEAKSRLNDRNLQPAFVAGNMMEREAADFYTTYAFKLFKEQFTRSWRYGYYIENGVITVRPLEGAVDDAHIVTWSNAETEVGPVVECSCKMFNFSGILCRHILRAFQQNNISGIPKGYLLRRWSKRIGTIGTLSADNDGAVAADNDVAVAADMSERYDQLSYQAQEIIDYAIVNLHHLPWVEKELAKLEVELRRRGEGTVSTTANNNDIPNTLLPNPADNSC